MLRCELLEHGLSFELDVLYDCCMTHHENLGRPIIKKPYHGEIFDWDKLFEIKKEHYLCQCKNTLHECQGCLYLRESDYSEYEKYISWIMFNQSKLCNSNCKYCGDNLSYNKDFYDVYPLIKDLMDKNYFKKGGLVIFQGGEPTLMKNFDKVLMLAVEHDAEIKINTSAIKFSDEICYAMKKGNVFVCISLDSPNREVYKKIKLTDKFDTVVENIMKYAACQTEKSVLKIKYILVPGDNDSIEYIDEFFEKMKSCNVKNIVGDLEYQYSIKNPKSALSPHLVYLFEYMKRKAAEEGFNFELFNFALYALDECGFSVEDELFAYKNLLSEKINSLKEQNKDKNVAYAKSL